MSSAFLGASWYSEIFSRPLTSSPLPGIFHRQSVGFLIDQLKINFLCEAVLG